MQLQNIASFTFKCGCKALLVFRVHVRLRSHKGLDDSKVAFAARIVQRCTSIQYVHCITQGKYMIDACRCTEFRRRQMQLQNITLLSYSHPTLQLPRLERQQDGQSYTRNAEVYIHHCSKEFVMIIHNTQDKGDV